MKRRKFGKSDLEIAPLVLGGNVFGWTLDERQSFAVLDAFVDAGFNAIDTADVYSAWIPGHRGGESETIIGNWLKKSGKRGKVALFTKVGMRMASGERGLRREHILKSAEDSLKRLQTDVIDLYQAHEDDAETPLEESLSAFDRLLREGKVRRIGASNYGAGRLREALGAGARLGFTGYQSLQPLYNLYDRQVFEEALEPLCREEALAVIPYYSLASGFLSGKYRTEADLGKSPRGQGIKSKYMNERGFRILKALDEVAEETKSNPSRVSIAWLQHRPSITAPIASATKIEQLEDLVHASELRLSPAQIARLDQASAWEERR